MPGRSTEESAGLYSALESGKKPLTGAGCYLGTCCVLQRQAVISAEFMWHGDQKAVSRCLVSIHHHPCHYSVHSLRSLLVSLAG